MAQGQDTLRRTQGGSGIQVSKQEEAPTEARSAPGRANCAGHVPADVYFFCRVRPSPPSLPWNTALMDMARCRGDIATLSTLCTEGLLASFKSRIAARPRDERLRWTLHSFLRGPKFVSQRIAMLPYKGAALRQVVVRLRSRQSLARLLLNGKDNKSETLVKGTGEENEVVEYLVLQRRMLKDEEGPWMIWGTTTETDLAKVLGSDAPTEPAVAKT